MPDLISNQKTSLSHEDTIVRAIQFFSTENWRVTSQTSRAVTFQGKPKIPWFMLLLTIVAFAACILPGVVLYILVIKKMYRFINLVVAATPILGGSEVTITYPKPAKKLVVRFISALPPINA